MVGIWVENITADFVGLEIQAEDMRGKRHAIYAVFIYSCSCPRELPKDVAQRGRSSVFALDAHAGQTANSEIRLARPSGPRR